MFHFPTFPPNALCVQAPVAGHDSSWVSPFGDPRITARLPTPRGLSQAPTTFFGSWCQGIHHVPLVACHYKRLFDARVHYAVLKKRAVPSPWPPRGRIDGSFGEEMVREIQRYRLDPSGPNNVPGTRPPQILDVPLRLWLRAQKY
jgi:hypothetical protein